MTHKIITKINDVLGSLSRTSYPALFDLLEDALGAVSDSFHPCQLAYQLEKMEFIPAIVWELIIVLLEEAVDNGDDDAMLELGSLYYEGNGCDRDYAKALSYYHRAADLGNRQAQENLGYCYYYGRSVPVDYEKAFHYFSLGAFDGHLVSLYKIGDMYLNGYYVEKNEKEAFLIYQHCLDLMNDNNAPFAAGPVFLRIGNCYLNGKGTDIDPKAAQLAYQRAEMYLYDMVENGDEMYRSSLEAAIKGQNEARKIRMRELVPLIF